MKIRSETPSDIEAIDRVTRDAFSEAPHTDHTEHFIVKALRNAGVLTISMVAELDGSVVGHVAVSPVEISDAKQGWYGLGPVSVTPQHQGEGIGSALMQAAISAMKRLNAAGCVLLGEPDYYGRFGFKAVDGLVLADVPPEYFQALLLAGDYPQGEVKYHHAFNATA